LTKSSGLKSNPDLMTLSPAPKDEACGGLVVLPDGEKLSNSKFKWYKQRQKNIPV
jgi:hypothetical protein